MSWDDDELNDFDDGVDLDEDEETTLPCPYCGEAVYDDAEQCPACGHYLSEEDAPRKSKPWWILIGVAISIAIVIGWVLFGF